MQSTAFVPTTTTLAVSPSRLLSAFAEVPDPRRLASVVYPLAAILTMTVVAILCNNTSVLAIAEWAGDQSPERLRELGFSDGSTPRQSTLQRLFAKLDGHALAAALHHAVADAATPPHLPRGSRGVAIDGKAQRGRLHYDSGGSPVHMLTAFCHEQGIVVAQEPIEQGADKAEAELTVAPDLIAQLDWQGRVLTGDALFCQRHLCQQVLAAGGDYLLLVKANQPRLLHAIELLFAADGHPLPLLDRREARTIDQGHGRTADTRHLVASTDLVGYLDWPGHAQVFQLERTWIEEGERKQQVRYGITSLPPEIGSAERLLALKRDHWRIENRLHRTADVTFGEDASQIHAGEGPTIFAELRATAMSLLHRAGVRDIVARLRRHSRHPEEAIALVLTDQCTRA
jgi:predicted transposase YbfD/YdcC